MPMLTGRELDAEIAKALGKDLIKSAFHENLFFDKDGGAPVLEYSSDWTAMGQLIGEMQRRGWGFCIDDNPEPTEDAPAWTAGLTQNAIDGPFHHGSADTMPEAVARATLKALTTQKEET